MKPVEFRIRISRIVSDRPLGASREQFTESLTAELRTLLTGAPAEPSNRSALQPSSQIAQAIADRYRNQ